MVRKPPRLKTRATTSRLFHRKEVTYELFVRDWRDRPFARVPGGFERFLGAGGAVLERILWSSFRFDLATSGGSFAI